MIVDEPRVTTTANEVRVEAAVDLERGGAGRPPSLWFVFPRAYEEHVTDRADAFAVALLPLAMSLGERLRVRGTLSYRLAAGMREYQRIQSAWKPDLFRQVEVESDGLCSVRRGEVAGAVGASFSGGVDSFHTLWSHLPENEPYEPFRVTHCLMINGFDEDSDLADTGRFRSIARLYEPMMDACGLQLVVVRTNLLEMVGYGIKAQAFAAMIAAPALALGGLFARHFIASGCKFTTMGLYPDGSHLMLDHVLSTETMETVHDDAHLTRVEKTVALSRWPETYDRLRVCYHATGVQERRAAIANCCACEKCLRTMVTLDLAGALDRYGSFPRPLRRRDVRNADCAAAGRDLFAREVLEWAAKAGRRDVVWDMRVALFKSLWVKEKIRAVARASSRLETRSRRYAAAVAAPKRLVKRSGLGRGWLY